jgi:hypothetical protein
MMSIRLAHAGRVLRLGACALAGVSTLATSGLAQRGGRGGGNRGQVFEPNVPYDGRFTYIRVKYDIPLNGGGFRGPDIKWAHDYPRGERHFAKIVGELSTIRTWSSGSDILTLDDPQLTHHPVAFITEPGFWRPNAAEVVGIRNYMLKGGFVIFDDFAGEHWMNFEEQMRKVFPNLRPIQLTLSHPIFDAFYKIKTLDYDHPYYRGMKSVFFGLFEDNDPKKRLMAVINYNNDISEYWEFSDTGMFPMQASNEAYKIGVNYIIYALTR